LFIYLLHSEQALVAIEQAQSVFWMKSP